MTAYEPQRQADNRVCVYQSRCDIDLRVKYDDMQIAMAKRRSCIRKYIDGDAIT